MNVLACSKRSDSRVRCEIRERRRKKARGREEESFTGVHFCRHSLTHPLQSFQLISAWCCSHNKSWRAPEWWIRWGRSKVVWEKMLHNKMKNKRKPSKQWLLTCAAFFNASTCPWNLSFSLFAFSRSAAALESFKEKHCMILTLPIEDEFNSDLYINGISRYTVRYHTILYVLLWHTQHLFFVQRQLLRHVL